MTRIIGSLVVVDGINATIRSSAGYKEDDQSAVLQNAASGLWPFYIPDAAVARNDVRFDARGGMVIRTVTEPGKPLMLGANVLGIGRYLGRDAP